MMRFLQQLLVPALLLFASIGLMVVGAEVLLRIADISYPVWYVPDSITGMALRPGAEAIQRREGFGRISISSAGLRDREHALEKPAGKYRIAILGDSYAEAVQVDVEQTFWKLLERELLACTRLAGRTPEVLNFGVSGFSTAQELLTFRHKARKYSPDLVLLAFTSGNDVRDNSRLLDGDSTVPYFVVSDGRLTLDDSFRRHPAFRARESFAAGAFLGALRYSRTLQLINEFRRAVKSGELTLFSAQPTENLQKGGEEYQPPHNSEWVQAWDTTEALLSQINSEVRESGARFSVATLSNPGQVNPSKDVRESLAARLDVPDLFYPERRIAAVGMREGFPVFNLAPQLQQIASEREIFLHGFEDAPGAGHWNAEGHRIAGELLAEMLCNNVIE